MKNLMKLVVMLLVAFATTTTYAQSTNKVLKKEFKTTQSALARRNKALEAQIKDGAGKDARKEAKSLEKEGFIAASGALPLEKQLEQSWKYQYDVDGDGYPIYIVSTQIAIGANYSAAKTEASTKCKVDIAGLISAEVDSIIEHNTSNKMISADEAESLSETIEKSKVKIQHALGRTIPVMEIQRKNEKGNVEVRMAVAFNTLKALEMAKQIMQDDLNKSGSKLADKLNELF